VITYVDASKPFTRREVLVALRQDEKDPLDLSERLASHLYEQTLGGRLPSLENIASFEAMRKEKLFEQAVHATLQGSVRQGYVAVTQPTRTAREYGHGNCGPAPV
jgi:hypothetical protein